MRQKALHECRSPSVKRFGDRQSYGNFWRSIILSQPIFSSIAHNRPQVFYAAASQVWNRRIFLLKLFNISIPVAKELLKHTSARTVHAKVIVKPARVV